MDRKPFKELPIGTTFHFTSSLALGYQGAKGPWVKISARKYTPEEDSRVEHRIGSINASTVPVRGKNKI